MHILIVTQYFWPEIFRINDLAAELVERGHRVTVLTGHPNYPEGQVFQSFINHPDDFSKYKDVDIVRVPMIARGKSKLRLIFNYLSYAISATAIGAWRFRRSDIDVIFVYQPSPVLVGLPAIGIKAITKKPIVLWVLDLWPETLSALGVIRSKSGLAIIRSVVSFIYRRCDLILGQSNSFLDAIRRNAGRSAKVSYFPSWAEDMPPLETVTAASEVKETPGSFNVLFTGNVGEAQDFPTIVKAAEILKAETHIKWLIVGSGRMYDYVNREIKQRGLEETLFLYGRFQPDRMPSFYKHADALLVSLQKNDVFTMTIPAKFQSYLMTGIPVIASLGGEGTDVIANSNAGLVAEPENAADLANKVRMLSEMPEAARREMGQNGLEYSMVHFNREQLITDLESMFQGLIDEQH